MSKTKLNVNEIEIVLYKQNEEEYISITDMAKFRDSERTNYIIQNWMRTRSAIEFLGLWEQLNNPNFKRIEFDAFRRNRILGLPHTIIKIETFNSLEKNVRRYIDDAYFLSEFFERSIHDIKEKWDNNQASDVMG